MPTLNYSGDVEVRDNVGPTLQVLVEDLIAAHHADTPITVDIGQVRPIGAGWLASVSLSANGSLSELVALEDEIATAAAELGLEPDVPTAKESIQVS